MKLTKERLIELGVTPLASPLITGDEVMQMAREILILRERGRGGAIEPTTFHPHAHPVLRNIDSARLAASMSISAMMRVAGVSNILWHHWSSARRQPRLADLEAVANTVGLTLVTEPKE